MMRPCSGQAPATAFAHAMLLRLPLPRSCHDRHAAVFAHASATAFFQVMPLRLPLPRACLGVCPLVTLQMKKITLGEHSR